MIVNGTVPHPQIDSAAAEGGSFLSTLRDIPNNLFVRWQTRKYGPENLDTTTLPPEALGKLGLAAFGVAYASLSYLQARYGMEHGHSTADYMLAGNTTRLDPSPDSSGDQGGRPWLFPDTESTHKASAVPEDPTPAQTTAPAPSPVKPSSIAPTPSEAPSPIPSPKVSQSEYDDLPHGEQSEDTRLIDQNTEGPDFMKIGGLLCLGSFGLLGLAGFGVYRHGRRVQAAESGSSYSILRDPDEKI